MTYILPLIVCVSLHSNVSSGLNKTIFPHECVSAVQGHSRSLTLVTIESAHATSY